MGHVVHVVIEAIKDGEKEGKCKFLVDGFPRSVEQAEVFCRGVSFIYLSRILFVYINGGLVNK